MYSSFNNQLISINVNESESSDEDDSNAQVGYHRLKRIKRNKILKYLSSITPSRKMIVKGLKYAYTNIESANEVIEMIVTAVKNNKNYVTHQLSYIYLINDILFNSQNTNIKYAWIYKELIQNKIPEIFWSMFNDSNVPNIEYLISKVRKVIDIWIEKKYFYDEFYNGILLYVNTPLSESVKNDFESKVKPLLETYEGELLELYTKDEKQLKEIAKKNGIYDSLSYPEIIELLLKVKERSLYEGCIRECDGEECDEEMLNMKIDKLKEILNIMRKEYQQLNMLDVDGVEINKAEYEFFGFKCENEEKEENEAENKKEEEYDDDIDGEPI